MVAGETIILKAVFTDENGNEVDPTIPVFVTVKNPDGERVVEDEEAVNERTGVFTHEFTTTIAGEYAYKFVSADGGVEQNTFTVETDKTA